MKPIDERGPGAIPASSVRVYLSVRTGILENDLRPGQRLGEVQLAQSLDVSRTPVREALIRLADEGLVSLRARQGAYVTPISIRRLFEAHTLRVALESFVCRTAALRTGAEDRHRLDEVLEAQRLAVSAEDFRRFREVDDALHARLSTIAGLPRAWTIVTTLKTDLDRARSLVQRDAVRAREGAREHEVLVAAVKGNDADAAERALRAHLTATLEAIQSVIQRHRDDFAE